MAEKTYRGVAALTLVRVGEVGDADAKFVQVYRGQTVPKGVSVDELKRLADEGFIEAGEQVAGLLIPEPAARKA